MLTFAIEKNEANVVLTEYLRYAGIISVNGCGHAALIPYSVEIALSKPDQVLITVECPKGLNAEAWAHQNIGRLASFGIKAIYWKQN